MIEEIPLLHKDHCEEMVRRVLAHRPYWIDRGHFHTFGAATYQDDPTAYPGIANCTNLLLSKLFARKYADIMELFAECAGLPCATLPGTALPGFHIFDSRANDHLGHPHIDEPFERIQWPVEPREPFSFTLVLALPACGGGLDYWPEYSGAQLDHYMTTYDKELPLYDHLPYKVGHLYIHDGLFPHRIANRGDLKEGEHRITLQGHGVNLGDQIALYF